MKKTITILIATFLIVACSKDNDNNKYIQAKQYGFYLENAGENPDLNYKFYDFNTGEVFHEGNYKGSTKIVSFQAGDEPTGNNYSINFIITNLNENDSLKVYFFAQNKNNYLNQKDNPNATSIYELNNVQENNPNTYEGDIMIHSREEFWIDDFSNN